MNCRDFDRELASAAGELSGAARAHAGTCPACSALLKAVVGPFETPELPAGLVARLTSGAAGKALRPVKPLAGELTRSLLLAIIALAVAGAGVAVMGAQGWRSLDGAGRAGFGVILALGLVLQAWLLARVMAPGQRLTVAPAIPAVFVAVASAAVAARFPVEHYPRFAAIAGACFLIGSAHAAAVQVLAWFVVRRGYVTEPATAALLAGGLGAVSGFAVLTVFCAHHDRWHLLLGHVGMAALMPAVRYVASSAWLRK